MSILHFITPAQSVAKAPEPPTQVSQISQEQKTNVIAAVIILEAGGEGVNGMKAVAEVIYNRAVAVQGLAAKKGKAVGILDAQYAVVTAKKQFSCLNDMTPSQAIAKTSQHSSWIFAERIVLDTKKSAVSNLTSGANHYCRFDCFPKWRDDNKMTVRIGAHVFFKL